MPRGVRAQLAVDEFLLLQEKFGWSKAEAWRGIAILLLSCDVWDGGAYQRLSSLRNHVGVPDVVVYRERNDFKSPGGRPNATVRRAMQLSAYLASELGLDQAQLCDSIGAFYRSPVISEMQPNNIVGHAFRSICVEILKMYGDPSVTYEEEVDPYGMFPGYSFATRSKDAKLDIMGFRNGIPVALISARWRFRHDRVDVPEEMLAYGPAARRTNPRCALYGLVGEFSPVRLEKILAHSPPAARNPILDATVHFAPDLISNGLSENGRLRELRSLEWLVDQTFSWK
jgi:hypothetical protein